MGGRGSSGGAGGSGAKFPKVQSPIDTDRLPALTGTQKQVSWANQIREQVLGQLGQAMYRTSSGYPTRAPDYVTSESDMKKAVSSVGTQNNAESKRLFLQGYDEMMKRLDPAWVIFYGHVPLECDWNVIRVKPHYDEIVKRRKAAKNAKG